ncbi:hypothetical protein ONS95_011352 [Cadophora gregata]|uniref:uncharacterized protein n=1 Tax=Cadophora gregata TaxID=51156 RepID=UPI0026DB1468|nr:uncharacterized protein ONS95_011352 [Cadophora gregata]KAK0119927.1 hypothetical protein ONS95_011352 [Cadophora gregata]KAK0120960.1 hypothetical protein ONS96_011155 [Cadophora gregata f. sp. sojae]
MWDSLRIGKMKPLSLSAELKLKKELCMRYRSKIPLGYTRISNPTNMASKPINKQGKSVHGDLLVQEYRGNDLLAAQVTQLYTFQQSCISAIGTSNFEGDYDGLHISARAYGCHFQAPIGYREKQMQMA